MSNKFEVDYIFRTEASGTAIINADDVEQAEEFAREQVEETHMDATDIEVTAVREILDV